MKCNCCVFLGASIVLKPKGECVYRVVGHGHREWRQGEAEQGRREQPQGQARGRDSNTERPYVKYG